MPETYHLEGLAVPETLDLLHRLLEQVGQDHPDVSADDLMLFETAVIEIAANMVEHGRPQGRVTYTFELRVTGEVLVADLADSGTPARVDLDGAMPDALAEDGRGLPLARAVLDGLEYERERDANRWRMTRLRQPG